jgi:hypothetical protein
MIFLGEIHSRSQLPKGLVARTAAAKYVDALTLEPMVPIVTQAAIRGGQFGGG